jgi:predicted permease
MAMTRAGVRRLFRLPVLDRGRTEAEVEAELRAHVEHRVEALVRRGWMPAAARAEAERRLGDPAARARLAREAWGRDRRLSLRERLGSAADDVAYTARSLRREGGYAAVVVLTLALGIGANATMFGVVDRLLLRQPAHISEPETLRRVYIAYRPDPAQEERTASLLNFPELRTLRESVAGFAALGGYMERTTTLGIGPEAREVELRAATAGFLEMLGARPALGRFHGAAEDAPPAGERVVVLGDELWWSEFGGRPDVLGETVDLGGTRFTVIGVAPPGLTGADLTPVDAWTPLAPLAADFFSEWEHSWNAMFLRVVGRLRPGATGEQVVEQATAARQAAYAGNSEAHRGARVVVAGLNAGDDATVPLESRIAGWLLAVAAIVLLVACANVANLYLARGLRRRREVAMRRALGISAPRLVRLLLAESLVLALAGGLVALAVVYAGSGLVRGVLLPEIDWGGSAFDGRLLAVAAALTLAVGVFTGLAPALQAARIDVAPALAGASTSGSGGRPGRARHGLAILQATFCAVLLVGTGLFLRSFQEVRGLELGLDADRVLAVGLDYQSAEGLSQEDRVALRDRRQALREEALARLAALPGATHAAAAIGSPLSGAFGIPLRVAGRDSIPSLPGGGPYISAVTTDYFATLGTPLLRGRTFQPGDGAGSEPVAIVSRTMARALWPHAEPLDACLYIGPADAPCSRVVGVVEDVRRFSLKEEAALQYYVPLGQERWICCANLLVRAEGRPGALVEPIRHALYELDASLRYVRVASYDELLDPQRRPWKLGASIFAICALLAFLIAAVGLYSVLAYLVTHRTREIGVRVALGGQRRHVLGLIVRQVLALAAVGIAAGLTLAYLGAPRLEALLFETSPRDGVVFAGVAALLLLAALAAGAAPALRAMRIPPTQALGEG